MGSARWSMIGGGGVNRYRFPTRLASGIQAIRITPAIRCCNGRRYRFAGRYDKDMPIRRAIPTLHIMLDYCVALQPLLLLHGQLQTARSRWSDKRVENMHCTCNQDRLQLWVPLDVLRDLTV